jgi:hypothetical protein
VDPAPLCNGRAQRINLSRSHLSSVLAEYEATTTDDGPTAAATSARLGPTTPAPTPPQEWIRRRAALGGLINKYEPAA